MRDTYIPEVKPSDILARAAELIDSKDEDYSCPAIDQAGFKFEVEVNGGLYTAEPEQYDIAHKVFDKLFKPENEVVFWFGGECTREQQQHRVMALLFAAEVAKDTVDMCNTEAA